jgi:RimJ/RimL family protein N-acetyltransferase
MAEPSPSAPPYPRELERTVRLANGAVVRLRPIRPDDAPRLIALYGRLSQRTAYQRFFTVMNRLPPDWAKVFATVDFRHRLAVVAERDTPAGPEIIGVGRYEPADGDDAVEVAFVVEDGWQRQGLGPMLLDAVMRAGEARGVRRFRAYVLADNHRMLKLLARHTDVIERRLEDGVVSLLFRARPDESSATAASP